jgi:two-component system response regulator HydG
VRFIAATNKDLEEEVARGRFREDLYYRLNVIALQLPTLRERHEDIEPLADHFLLRAAARIGRTFKGISPAALASLQNYNWPGNVRELENVIERGAILARGETITSEDLPLKIHRPPARPTSHDEPSTLRETEQRQIARILHQVRWNKSRAAQILDITRRTLDRKITEYGLHPEE